MENIQNTHRNRGVRHTGIVSPQIKKKITKEQLPVSIENGCIIVDDAITEEQLAAIRSDV